MEGDGHERMDDNNYNLSLQKLGGHIDSFPSINFDDFPRKQSRVSDRNDNHYFHI